MAVSYRFKCPSCGNVVDSETETGACPKCGGAVDAAGMGMIQIYRMGSPLGVAVPEEVYLNNEAYGVLMNKQSAKIMLPYGTYNVHCALTMNRKCNDLSITLAPGSDKAYVKAAIKAGFISNKIQLTQCDAGDMPE